MLIRREAPHDFAEIYSLITEAFKTAAVTSGTEQDFALRLRNSANYIPELALVAEISNKIVGHIMLTKQEVFTASAKFETLLLGPISVSIECRNQGIGSELIYEAFKIARKLGFHSVVLVGDPAYYSRFGFKSSIEYAIKNTNGIPDEYAMACELTTGALDDISGSIYFETE